MAYQVPMRCWAEVVSVGMGLEGTYESMGEKGLPWSALSSFYPPSLFSPQSDIALEQWIFTRILFIFVNITQQSQRCVFKNDLEIKGFKQIIFK